MALVDYAALVDKMNAPSQQQNVAKVLGTIGSGQVLAHSTWRGTGGPAQAAIPGAPAIPVRTTLGAVPIHNAASGDLRVWARRIATSGNSSALGYSIQFCDRLAHGGGLSGIVTTAQAFATPALTRSTSGKGVRAAFEIYTALGATLTTATMSYTNSAGTPGQISQPVEIGSTSKTGAARFLPISLAAGDEGVQAVASVTLLASTLTAGNFGVTLYKPITPILPLGYIATTAQPLLDVGGYAGLVDPDACLFAIVYGIGATANVNWMADLAFFEC